MNKDVHSSIIHNSRKGEATQESLNSGMNEQNVASNTTEYHSALIKEGQGFSGGPGVKNLPVQRVTWKLTLPYVK